MISYTGFVRAAVFAVVAVVFSSCAGYQMGASRPAAMEGVKTLAVPLFRNNTLEPRASSIVSNNVVRLLHNDGTFKLVDSSLADAVLKGTITRFDRRQLRSARNNSLRTRELELRVWIDYTVETRTGAVLMRGTANGSDGGRTRFRWMQAGGWRRWPGMRRRGRRCLGSCSRG